MNREKFLKICLASVFLLFTSSSIIHASFLEDEAGISAYSTVSSVDIVAAVSAYKNIEYQTSEYIIGSVAIPNYNETDDVHVYLHISGEIIAYYLRDIHFCHMIDWKAYHSTKQITGSKLHTALGIISSAMGSSLSEIKYYDFRYPDAPNIKIVVDYTNEPNTTDSFRLLVPDTYNLHAAFWSHAVLGGGWSEPTISYFKFDGSDINYMNLGWIIDWNVINGDFDSEQLSKGIYHSLSTSMNRDNGSSYVAIVLLYTEP